MNLVIAVISFGKYLQKLKNSLLQNAATASANKAIELYKESIKIEKELGDRRGVAYTLAQLGLLYKEIGEKEKAIKCMEEALKMFEQMGLKRDAEKARKQLKHLKLTM